MVTMNNKELKVINAERNLRLSFFVYQSGINRGDIKNMERLLKEPLLHLLLIGTICDRTRRRTRANWTDRQFHPGCASRPRNAFICC